ncbi:MAG TPA: amidase [Pyrinomonadaceae bacterium]|jgi:Asp-tRNA(Asn)/Glu-tRNA(Gln) amidotransferase A subunit family amidase|nr:amidase [Pyrinomonadaceae bacterium]
MEDLLTTLLHMPLEGIARAIRARQFSAREVMSAHLERIARLNPQLNAIVTLAPDALERARHADEALARGQGLGQLHGIPLTIKDTIETKGLRTTSGSLMRADYVPCADATAVARLKAAGAIIIGKTNVSEMAMAYDASNPVFGRTNNPHDPRLTPGGSSGGEAASIAAGLSLAGLGSDLSGSVRVPAHFCGISGLKPTTGSVPGEGQCPPAIGPFSLGAVIGPMARRVADLATLFRVLTMPLDAQGELVNASPENLQSEPWMNLRGWRAAWYADDGVSPVTEETRLAVESAARALEDAGLIIEERRPPGVERGPDLWSSLFSRAALLHLRENYAGREASGGPMVRAIFKAAGDGPAPTQDEFITAWVERDRLRAALVRWMDTTPLIIAPVGATHAFEHDARRLEIGGQSMSVFRAFGYSQTFNVYGLPAVCVPAGRSREGLPVGVQVVGRPFAEESVLAAALIIEKSLGGWQPPPDALSQVGHHPL